MWLHVEISFDENGVLELPFQNKIHLGLFLPSNKQRDALESNS